MPKASRSSSPGKAPGRPGAPAHRRAWRCVGRLIVTVEAPGVVALPGTRWQELAPGDLVALRVSGSLLRLHPLREFYGYPWHLHSAANRGACVERFLRGPLAAVSPGGVVALPADLFPVAAGERVLWFAMDRGSHSALYLKKAGGDD